MASKRRGGGFRPPELRGTLGTLLRTAWQQAGGVRDALERGARSGRERLDGLRADRRRTELLADLGEIVLDLIRRGEIDPDELPEVGDLVAELDALDADADADHDDGRDELPTPPTRRRFDDRGDRGGPSRGAPADRPRDRGRAARGDDDGTISSGARWSPPRPAAPQRVWRPPADEPAVAAARHHTPAEIDPEATPPARRPVMPPHPHRQGGISFEDDDLADYMHPDDVPPKDRADGDDS